MLHVGTTVSGILTSCEISLPARVTGQTASKFNGKRKGSEQCAAAVPQAAAAIDAVNGQQLGQLGSTLEVKHADADAGRGQVGDSNRRSPCAAFALLCRFHSITALLNPTFCFLNPICHISRYTQIAALLMGAHSVFAQLSVFCSKHAGMTSYCTAPCQRPHLGSMPRSPYPHLRPGALFLMPPPLCVQGRTPSDNLYIRGLPASWTDEDLANLFAPYGGVTVSTACFLFLLL